MLNQYEITLSPYPRGFHVISNEIWSQVELWPENGLMHILLMHTSAGICINESADPSVLTDFASFFDRLVPEQAHYWTHIAEGSDDMPAHVKSALVGHQITIPIRKGRPVLGTWQGIYLCEFRNNPSRRRLFVTVLGE